MSLSSPTSTKSSAAARVRSTTVTSPNKSTPSASASNVGSVNFTHPRSALTSATNTYSSTSSVSAFSPQSQTHIKPTSSSIHRTSSSSPHTATHSSSSASNPTRPRMPRSNSHLRRAGGPGALVIPIPPTLVNSPHLQSPNSVFRRQHAGVPRASPGFEEERWLRDTVPIGSNGSVGDPLTAAAAGAGAANMGGYMGGKDGYGRSRGGSVGSPTSPAFSLLPSTLPRQTVYTQTHAHAQSSRDRG